MKRSIKNIAFSSLTKNVRLILLLSLIISSFASNAQNQKARKRIEIDDADLLLYKQEVIANAQRLIGNVQLSHKNIVMYCDSAWLYTNSNVADAFGKVHIISNDTLHMYADFINFDTDHSLAKARGNVVLKDPSLTLTTDSLNYDLENKIGYYNWGGTIKDSTNTLTSIIGRYYSNDKTAFFKDSVKLVNKDYTMYSDTMKYNTEKEIVYIVGATEVISDSSYLYTEKGWYDTKTNEAELLRNSFVRKGDSQLEGDSILYNDIDASGEAMGNVIINDYANQMIVAGHYASYNDFTQNALVTDSALYIQYYEEDSLFLHADTLYTMPDTVNSDEKIISTYHNVRFFRNDLQGICDSLTYYTNDSTIKLYHDPVLWSIDNQMTADRIEVENNPVPPNLVYMYNKSFIVQEVDTAKYNQIKGKNMIGYIKGSHLYLVDVNGNGQSIYYPADEKGVIGVNKAESSNIKIYLEENAIRRITFLKSTTGKMNPLIDVNKEYTSLDGFVWRNSERPKNRLQIYSNDTTNFIQKLPFIHQRKKPYPGNHFNSGMFNIRDNSKLNIRKTINPKTAGYPDNDPDINLE